MIGGDLKADRFLTFRNYRKIETGGEDTVAEKMFDKLIGCFRITNQKWHDRVFADDGFVAKADKPLSETVGHLAEVRQQPKAPFAVDDINGSQRRRRFGDGQRISVYIKWILFTKIPDDSPGGSNVAAIDAESFAQRRDKDIHSPWESSTTNRISRANRF